MVGEVIRRPKLNFEIKICKKIVGIGGMPLGADMGRGLVELLLVTCCGGLSN